MCIYLLLFLSLGVLTLLFIKLFLQKDHVLSLDDAASSIFEKDNEGQTLFKSKSRRLYDIANVLKSLGLIEKIKNSENKNVYRWIGSEGFTLNKKQDAKKKPLMVKNLNEERKNDTIFQFELKDKSRNNIQPQDMMINFCGIKQAVKSQGSVRFLQLSDSFMNEPKAIKPLDFSKANSSESILKKRPFCESYKPLDILIDAAKRPNLFNNNKRTLYCPKPIYKHLT